MRGRTSIRATRIALLLVIQFSLDASIAAAADKHVGPVVDLARIGSKLYSVSQVGVFVREGKELRLAHKPEFRVFGMAVIREVESKEEIVLLAETEIEEAIRLLFEQHRLVVEGSGALGVGGMLKQKERFRGKKVVAAVCGRNIDLELFKRIIR